MARWCWKDLFDVRHLIQEGSAKPEFGYAVIQKLISSYDPDTGLAYIYFDHKLAWPLEPADYFAGLVRQFEEQKKGVCISIRTVYDKHTSKSPKLDFHNLKSFLSESTAYFKSGAYI